MIRSHLHDADAFERLASGDFVITFANRNNETATRKIQIIRDELWERLFGVTEDKVLSEVQSELHEVEITEEDSATSEGCRPQMEQEGADMAERPDQDEQSDNGALISAGDQTQVDPVAAGDTQVGPAAAGRLLSREEFHRHCRLDA